MKVTMKASYTIRIADNTALSTKSNNYSAMSVNLTLSSRLNEIILKGAGQVVLGRV